MRRARTFDLIALTLLIIGAINWGLVGLLQFDLIAMICGGSASVVSRIIYALIGVSGLYCLTLYGRIDSHMVMSRD
ncbi:MAG: DUF378 domain-containing protein [Clostridiales bacterium]|jgi:uncharacterized membrane protein YuzA (DUF378 family)|nr:DUF378 domain-containing protein [Clostridiales bacterium]